MVSTRVWHVWKSNVMELLSFKLPGFEIRLCLCQSCGVVANGAFFVPWLDGGVNLNSFDMKCLWSVWCIA